MFPATYKIFNSSLKFSSIKVLYPSRAKVAGFKQLKVTTFKEGQVKRIERNCCSVRNIKVVKMCIC